MSDKPISPLRQRMIDDMTARRFTEDTQRDYVRNVRMFAAFLGRSPDTATKEDLRRFQLHMARQQISPGSINAPNVRTRASKYAKILDGFARKRVRADQVPERIQALGGVEDAYRHFLAAERGLQITVDADDEATDEQLPLIPRKGGLRAARGGNDDKVQGDVDAESPSGNSLDAAIGGRRRMRSRPARRAAASVQPNTIACSKSKRNSARRLRSIRHLHKLRSSRSCVAGKPEGLRPSRPPFTGDRTRASTASASGTQKYAGDDRLGEGFRTPAPCGTVVRGPGPAFESPPRRKPRAGRGARLVGRDLWRF